LAAPLTCSGFNPLETAGSATVVFSTLLLPCSVIFLSKTKRIRVGVIVDSGTVVVAFRAMTLMKADFDDSTR